MNYLSVEHISKSFGERVLFEDISFGINKDQKVGFVAKNGTGKTTLLNILAGEESADSGEVIYRKDLRVSYLSQRSELEPSLTVEETISGSDNPVLHVITAYESALTNPDDQKALQSAMEAMDRHRAWDFETQYKQVLYRLKLTDLGAKVSELSGGQQKRLSLAVILLQQPDLLILDEPTNHLDLEKTRRSPCSW